MSDINSPLSLKAAQGKSDDFFDAAELVSKLAQAMTNGEGLGLVLDYRHKVRLQALEEAQQVAPSERQPDAPAELYTPGRCRLRLIAEGKVAVPRTCKRCGLGPCPLPQGNDA